MSQVLTVKEYETIRIGNEFSSKDKIITKSQANAIENWERINKKSIFKWGNRKIIPQQWVGIIGIDNLQIEILPKIEMNENQMIRKNLLYMLFMAKEVPFREGNIGDLKTDKSSFFECYISIFIEELKQAIKKGIIHQYHQTESNESFMKGKLATSKHIRKNLIDKTKFYIRYDEFSVNNLANRIIKVTVIKLIGVTQIKSNLKDLHTLKSYFADVNEREFQLSDFSRLVLTRANKHYRQLFEMCKLFLRDESPSFYSGKVTTFSLLFDMNKIYENFIRNIMIKYKDDIFKDKMYEIKKQINNKYLFRNDLNKGVFKLIPDNIIIDKNSHKVVKIIDTKWKVLNENKRNLGISQSDVYQMYAYAREFDCEEVILLYPQVSSNSDSFPIYYNETFLDRKIRIVIKFINLNVFLPSELYLIVKELNTCFYQ